MTKKEAIELFKDIEVLVFRDVKQKYFHEDIEDAFKMAIEALEVDVRCSGFETQELVVKGGINHNFESCDKCKYRELEPEVCQLMGCIHAWSEMRDCYKEVEE